MSMASVLFCSIDSLLASLAIGLRSPSQSATRKFILAFAACDFIGTLAGVSLHPALEGVAERGPSLWLSSTLLTALTALLLILGGKTKWLFGVPVMLALDNFLAGLLGGHAVPSPWIAGLSSGFLAWSGFILAQIIGQEFPKRRTFLTCAVLAIVVSLLFH